MEAASQHWSRPVPDVVDLFILIYDSFQIQLQLLMNPVIPDVPH